MKFATGVSTLAFLVASAALVMVLWPILSEAPWEENDWSTLAAPTPKEVTSPPLPNPGGQPILGGKIDSLERCVSAFQHHIHSYKSTDVSHSHDLQRGYLGGDSYSISAHQPWFLSDQETSSPLTRLASMGC